MQISLAGHFRRLLSSTSVSALLTAANAVLLVLVASSPARAQTSWTGTNSANWFDAGNWTAGVPGASTATTIDTIAPNSAALQGLGASGLLIVGDLGTGSLLILNGGTLRSNGAGSESGIIGANAGSGGVVTVTGANSTWEVTKDLIIGDQGSGTLFIQDGGVVTTGTVNAVGADIARASGSVGMVMVTDPGSAWNVDGPVVVGAGGNGTLVVQNGGVVNMTTTMFVGANGNGSVFIQNGGIVNSGGGGGNIAQNAGSTGAVTVTGAGSAWNMGGQLTVGQAGSAMLTIADGGNVSSGNGRVGNFGSGTVLVTGPDSTWTANGNIIVQVNSTLTVADSGTVSASSIGGGGTVNIGAAPGSQPVAPGFLNTPSQNADINFNHTATDYVFAPRLGGTLAQSVNVLAGTTIFTAANTYGGMTLIDGGTLKAGAVDTFSPNSPHTVAGAGTLDLGGFNQTVLGLTNAGLVNFGEGTPPGTTLTVTNYVGQGGTLALNTFLGTDGSPTDQLVINGGTASGTSNIAIKNAGGPGALTSGDGIQVVLTTNGGTTAPGAFALAGPVAAGPFEYLLFRGNQSGAGEDWFLRSAINCEFDPAHEACRDEGAGPDPIIPIYRPEVAVYSAIPEMARRAALATLGTFHERQGDQGLLRGPGWLPASWGRVLGQHTERDLKGTVSPSFDGTLAGFQAGQDIVGFDSGTGHRDRLGLFAGYASTSGNVRGFALAEENFAAGKLDFDATSLGGYWTHVGPFGWYVDAVAMGTWYDGTARSHRGFGLSVDGSAFTGSLEGGLPVRLGWGLTLEPQAQIIWQHQSLDNGADAFSTVAFGDEDAVTGRLGARLVGSFGQGATRLLPYLKANVWHRFAGTDVVTFADVNPIVAEFDATMLELGGGLVAKQSEALDLYVTGSYTTDLNGGHEQTFSGTIGARVTW